MQKIARAFLIFLLVVASLCASATSTSARISAAPAASTSETRPTIELLQAQLEITQQYHSSLLDTVYWALGTVVVLVTVLLGVGWFANFRVYERDKDALRRELLALVAQSKNELEEALAAKVDGLRPDIEAKLAQRVESVEASVTYLSRRLSTHMATLERDTIRKAMHSETNLSLAATRGLRLLKLCIADDPDEVPDVLHFLLKTLEKGGKFSAFEITDLNSELDKLPSHYHTLVEKLRSKLVASDIF